MELVDFSAENPWWRGKENIGNDKHIKEFFKKKYRHEPPILKEIKLRAGNLYTLRGPRQVGKTTLVKLLIKRLLEEKNVAEKSVFYAGCDMLANNNELLSLLREFLQQPLSAGEKYVFLDEVSGIENWQKAIKFLVDSGELESACLFLTGSHTLDIKHGFERLPGRTGKLGKDYLLLPMTFREFAKVVRADIVAKIPCMDSLSINGLNKAASIAMPFDRELKVLFGEYMNTGGFPLTVNEFYSENKTIPDYVYEVYMRWVIGDIVRWGKQENILKQVLRNAVLKQGTATSWDSFAKEAEIKSHKTVSSYVEDLENMFVFFVLRFMDLNKKVADYNKNKKIYFFDPFIYNVFNRMFYSGAETRTPAVVEAAAVAHFARFSELMTGDAVFYWKNARETDIVAKLKNGSLFAVEVKYQEKISSGDFEPLYRFKEGILATKSALKLGKKYSAIPVHLLLAVMP